MVALKQVLFIFSIKCVQIDVKLVSIKYKKYHVIMGLFDLIFSVILDFFFFGGINRTSSTRSYKSLFVLPRLQSQRSQSIIDKI